MLIIQQLIYNKTLAVHLTKYAMIVNYNYRVIIQAIFKSVCLWSHNLFVRLATGNVTRKNRQISTKVA